MSFSKSLVAGLVSPMLCPGVQGQSAEPPLQVAPDAATGAAAQVTLSWIRSAVVLRLWSATPAIFSRAG